MRIGFRFLPLTEELPAVPAVVASLRQGEADGAAGAAVHHLVLHPVVSRRAAGLVAHRPAEDSTAPVSNQDLTVIPAETKQEQRETALNRVRSASNRKITANYNFSKTETARYQLSVTLGQQMNILF